MRIRRMLPPAAAPIHLRDIVAGMKGLIRGQRELDRFEAELRAYFGVKHCFLVSSGKAALTCILLALKDIFPERNEVLIPAFTCFSVPSGVTRAGLKVRLCDVDPDTLDFDFGLLSRILGKPQNGGRGTAIASNGVLAVVSTHLFGLPADIAKLNAVLKDSGITIIEDAAQAMGGKWRGENLGTLGDVGFFSLGRGKSISTVEGGLILTDHDDIADKIRTRIEALPRYGFVGLLTLVFKTIFLALFTNPFLFWLPKAIPFLRLGETIYEPDFEMRKMSEFQAGLARDWHRKLTEFQQKRAINTKLWRSVINADYILKPISGTCSCPDLIRFPIYIDHIEQRERILRESQRRGLGIMPAYPDSLAGIQQLKELECREFPVAKQFANHLLTLPIHPFVSGKDNSRIAKLISEVTGDAPNCIL